MPKRFFDNIRLAGSYGPLYFRLVSGFSKLTPAYAEKLAELALSGFLRS